MKTLLQLAVLGIVIYLAVTRLVPWLSSQGEGLARSGTATELSSSDCINNARRAADGLASEVRDLRPPVDQIAWTDSTAKIDDRIFAAESSCTCGKASCETATSALGILRGLQGEYDSAIRSEEAPPLNAAREFDRIFTLLDEAASYARDGD